MRFAIALALLFSAACGDDQPKTGPQDAGVTTDAPLDASCFDNPQTNYEIINACTTAQKVYTTHPTPPLTLPDGGLPSLPP